MRADLVDVAYHALPVAVGQAFCLVVLTGKARALGVTEVDNYQIRRRKVIAVRFAGGRDFGQAAAQSVGQGDHRREVSCAHQVIENRTRNNRQTVLIQLLRQPRRVGGQVAPRAKFDGRIARLRRFF